MEIATRSAAWRGHSGVVRKILENITDLEARTMCLGSALIGASSSGQEGCVRLFLEEGRSLEPNVMRHSAGEALAVASGSSHLVIVELLLEYGADVNETIERGDTPLHEASCGGHAEATRLLLDNGANIEAVNEIGNRPLHTAIDNSWSNADNGEQTVLLLLERGADVNVYGGNREPALITAAMRGNARLIPHLLRYGADTTAKDYNCSRTSLEWAVLNGHLSVVRILLTSDYSATMREGLLVMAQLYHAMTPYSHKDDEETNDNEESKDHEETKDDEETKDENMKDISQLVLKLKALQSEDLRRFLLLHHPVTEGDEAVTRLFIDMGADLEAKSYEGDMALHRAAGNGHTGIVRILLDYGADIEAQNEYHETALCVAGESGQSATVQLLIDMGANIEHDESSFGTPLIEAVQRSHEATVRLLLANGANPNTALKGGGGTALHIVASHVDSRYQSIITRLLISKGARMEIKDRKGETPLLAAVKFGKVNMVETLLELGADPNTVAETTTPAHKRIYEVGFHTAMRLVHEAKQRQTEVLADDGCE
ncbi:MAG: hypothetical protein Q9187_006775 [Circinaria calcarea]